MKKLLFACLLITVCLSSIGQNVPSYVPTNGLVGWWPFNGNANDESGNGNNGVVNGATLTTDRSGNNGKAYRFDGISNYIELGRISGLNSNQDLSLSGWISYSDWTLNDQYAVLIAPNPNASLVMKANSELSCNVSNCNCPNDISVKYNLTDSSWHHFSLVYKLQTGILRLFLDGIQVDSSVESIYEYYTINNPNSRFGNYHFNSFYFRGKLDDISLYNRALTQQEITNLYNASTSAPAPCPTLPANLQTGLVGYWPFCGNANDESGNGNNGTVNGAVLTSDRFGNANKAYSFDGITDVITFQQLFAFHSSNNASLSIWLNGQNPPNGVQGTYLKSRIDQPDNNRFNLFVNPISQGLKLNVDYRESNSNIHILNIDTMPSGNWTNFVLTRNNNIYSTYINGQLASISIDNNPILPNSLGWVLGNDPSSNSDYAGKIDDICIWNRALDSTEITQLYQTQSTSSSYGNTGINVAAPQRNLHVKDVIRLEPRNTPPDNPVIGDIYMDGLLKKLRVYDGTAWQNCW
jgi:hypothetical protein